MIIVIEFHVDGLGNGEQLESRTGRGAGNWASGQRSGWTIFELEHKNSLPREIGRDKGRQAGEPDTTRILKVGRRIVPCTYMCRIWQRVEWTGLKYCRSLLNWWDGQMQMCSEFFYGGYFLHQAKQTCASVSGTMGTSGSIMSSKKNVGLNKNVSF